MAKTPLIRDGKLNGNPMAGLDLKSLSQPHLQKLNRILAKAQSNVVLTGEDVAELGAIRKAATPEATQKSLSELIADMKKVFS